MDTFLKSKEKSLILIVDDNPANIRVVGTHLRKDDVEIAVASSGAKALSIVERKKPDLILLDIMMPEMDGYEVCSELKKNPETDKIPIIFLTAKSNPDDAIKAFELGAVDYITKPFNAAELRARVGGHLNLKLYQDRLVRQTAMLELLNAEKNEFLGIAAHDLKNPIYNIAMLAKVIRDDKDISREDLDEYSGDIVGTSEGMLELIGNLLDINAIEQGKVKFEIRDVNISRLAADAAHNYGVKAAKKDIEIVSEIDREKICAKADFQAASQTLDNLLSNSVKYSPFGKKVFIRAKQEKDFAVIEIEDRGPGFTEEDKSKLFRKFERLSARPTGNEHSTGLGLSIVKRYVDAMNGEIECVSEIGNGAKFIVKLPAGDDSCV